MKKCFLLSLLFLIFNITILAQHIENGVYANGPDYFLCVKNDTILNHFGGVFWYLGTYKFEDNKYYYGQNLLFGKNAFIEKEPCSPDSIEIKLICKYRIGTFGAPQQDSTIYEGESDFYYMSFNRTYRLKYESRDKKGIKIPKGQLSEEELSSGFLMVEGGLLSGFQDYFDFPLEHGIRYIIKHKYYKFEPCTIFEKPYEYFTIKIKKEKNELWFKENNPMCDQYTKLQYVSPNVDSCFNELKNKFPLLFE